jgi:PKD repeat protein
MLRRLIAVMAATGLTASVLVGIGPVQTASAATPSPPPVQDSSANMVSADALPTVQIDDGVIWSQVMIGNIVYAAGNFSNTRPYGAAKGTSLTPRSNVLAYNITTGNLVAGFAPNVNGQVRVITKSPDGSRLYIGGDFNQVNGVAKYRIAALNPTDGSLVSGFNAIIGGAFVSAIAATNSTVYIGGALTSASGAARANLAAYSSGGALLSWTPSADKQVDTMVMTPDGSRVIIGGRFGTVNGATQRGLAALDPNTGETIPWAATKDIRNGISTGSNAGKAGIYSLSADSNAVYGTGWGFADVKTGNLEGAFSAEPDTGEINWVENCHGDTYSVYSDDSTVYTLSHAHYCGSEGGFPQSEPDWSVNQRHALAFTAAATGTLSHDPYAGGTYQDWYGTPAPSMINWFPDFYTGTFTGMSQAAWSVTGNGDYLAVGGEFPGVNNTKQQYGLVRFSKKSLTTPRQGPRLSGANWPITVNTSAAGLARVSFPANWDRDNMNLTYRLIRDGVTANPVAVKTVSSTFWNTPTVGMIDSKATVGSHTYRVVVSDPDGNSVTSSPVTATVSAGTTSAYPLTILNDDASLYWRLGDSSGTAASDLAGANTGNIKTGVTLKAPGAIHDDPDTAAAFNGSSGYVAASSSSAGPDTFTVTAWINTSTRRGGKVIGFGSSNSGSSSSYDRHVYMDNSGHLIFGVYPGSAQTIQSNATYNDSKWHFVAASLGADGMHMYVDGSEVAQRTDITTGQGYTGYWRIGGDNLNGWPSAPSSTFFSGSIDEFAVFSRVLSGDEIQHLYTVGTEGPTNQAPTAAFSGSADKLKVSVDAGTSADADGSIADYAWDWGDGSAAGSGETATHTYSEAGTYTVKLTVTDNDGATDSASRDMTVTANEAPTAKFASVSNGLALSVDASESVDPDGSISSYVWEWGDGTPDGSGQISSHAYSATGDYSVKLTVTDNDGASNSISRTVSVTKPPAGALAVDKFGRSVSSGWGTADSGGPWALSGSASAFTVSGGTGNISMAQIRQSNRASLASVSARDVSITTQVSLNKRPDGGGAYVYISGRRTSAGEELLKLQFTSNGSVVMSFSRMDGNTETTLSSTTLSGVSAEDTLKVRFELSGTFPTTLSGKVWKASDSEPSAWTRTMTDNASNVQSAGSVGLMTYSSGTMSNFPVIVSFDDFEAKAISDGATNELPTAAFGVSSDGLITAVDGSMSSDADGSIASYLWDWGDGSAKGAGSTATHTYASPGTYTITLTVTDNSGGTGSVAHDVDVSSVSAVIADDSFSRTISGGWGTAGSGGDWTVNGATAQYAVADGAGTINLIQARQSNMARLSAVSARDVVLTADVSLDQVPDGNGVYVYFSARMTATGEEMLKLQFLPSGAVVAQLSRYDNGVETIMATASALNTTSSDRVRVRFQLVGDGSTTTLSGKVWSVSAAEPTAWLLTAQDTTPARQGPGAVGLRTYTSGTATRFPVVASFDDFHVVPAAAGE